MKRIIEIIFSALALTGLILYQTTSLGIVMLSGLLILACLYVVAGWNLFQSKDGVNNIGLSLFMGWLLSLPIIGMIFILKDYPGEKIFLILSVIAISAAIILIVLKMLNRKTKEYTNYYIGFIFRLIFVMLLFGISLI
ncbi:MAG: hypothetical protein Kow0068_03480 [Marinilabiliales bacterium]